MSLLYSLCSRNNLPYASIHFCLTVRECVGIFFPAVPPWLRGDRHSTRPQVCFAYALVPVERQALERSQRSTTIAAGLARRGQILLLLAARFSQPDVGQQVGDAVSYPAPQRPHRCPWPRRQGQFSPPDVAIHVVRLAFERPNTLGRSLSQWDCDELAHQLVAAGLVRDISAATVQRILAYHHLKPWRHHLWLYPMQPRDVWHAMHHQGAN